jgi:hypothetical protein
LKKLVAISTTNFISSKSINLGPRNSNLKFSNEMIFKLVKHILVKELHFATSSMVKGMALISPYRMVV